MKGDIDMFTLIHYHPDHPENRNLKIVNNEFKQLKGYKNKKPIWRKICKEDITMEHLDKTHGVYLKHMEKRGRDNVTNGEINHWKEVGEPTGKLREKMGNCLVKVIKYHANNIN